MLFVKAVAQHCHGVINVGFKEIQALEIERQSARLRQRVGKQVAIVEFRLVPLLAVVDASLAPHNNGLLVEWNDRYLVTRQETVQKRRPLDVLATDENNGELEQGPRAHAQGVTTLEREFECLR